MTMSTGRRILAVDDDEAVLSLLEMFLVGEGYSVETALNGQVGLEKIGTIRPDLILTDRSMPVMCGDEFARRAKTLFPSLPVIMITGGGQAMRIRGECPDGVDLVLPKPVERKLLVETVLAVLTERAAKALELGSP